MGTAILRRFERYLQKHALSPATIRNYLADLRAFSRWHTNRAPRATDFSAADFRAYREHLCQETTHSPATVNRRLQSLRLFGRFLHETGQVDENPTLELALIQNGHDNHTAPRILSRTEIARLFDAVADARPSLEQRDVAIMQLMLYAGLRVHEVAALRLDDVVLNGRRSRVQVQGNRRDKPRVIPLNATVIKTVREYLVIRPAIPRMDHLFLSQRGRPLSMRSIQRLVETYARSAGLKNVCAQSLRHTCAKNMLVETEDAGQVARWLGHRNTKMLDRYLES